MHVKGDAVTRHAGKHPLPLAGVFDVHGYMRGEHVVANMVGCVHDTYCSTGMLLMEAGMGPLTLLLCRSRVLWAGWGRTRRGASWNMGQHIVDTNQVQAMTRETPCPSSFDVPSTA